MLLAITVQVYWAGLPGPFLFDDFANLDALGEYGGIRDWETFRLYVFGGNSGPTGRPLSLLSFLINDNAWPTEAWAFKYTNLMLHLLNGVLLFVLIRFLLQSRCDSHPVKIGTIALLATGLWLLHPFYVSTVLYAVQRMAQLATLFTLLGLLGYCRGRAVLVNRPRAGYVWMSLSLGVGTLLAVLSKENGALTPLLAWVLEMTVLGTLFPKRPARIWRAVFFWTPVAVFICYLLYLIVSGNMAGGYALRPFSPTERLLTEARVLIDYLYYLFVPRVNSPGLLIQDFPLSRGLLSPPSTLICLTGIVFVIAAAILYRRRCPFFSLAVLFFFTGHILESTILPLEIYFEHRNYLPGVFLFLPFALGVENLARHHPKLIGIGIVSMFALLGALTFMRANLWKSEESLAYHWANIHPDSQRAQRHAALVAENFGKPELALYLMNNAVLRFPHRLPTWVHHITLQCRYNGARPEELERMMKVARTQEYDFRTYEMLHSFVAFAPTASCRGISANNVEQFLDALLQNPGARGKAGPQRQVFHLKGVLYLQQERGGEAAEAFSQAFKIMPDPEAGMLETALLASHQFHQLALAHLAKTEQIIRSKRSALLAGFGKREYFSEIERIRREIKSDMVKSRI